MPRGLLMRTKVVGKRCKQLNYTSCAAVVELSRQICESCGGPLEVVEAADKRPVIAIALAAILAPLIIGVATLTIFRSRPSPVPARAVERPLSPANETSMLKLL